jgi:hypothetical protein
MSQEQGDERLDVLLGLRVTETAERALRHLVGELSDRGRKATKSSVLDHLIKVANASELERHFPKKRTRR